MATTISVSGVIRKQFKLISP